MKHLSFLIGVVTVLSVSINSFAGSASHGSGGKGYEVSGCNGIGNIVNNIKGYSVSVDSADVDNIDICEENKYSSEGRLETFQQIAERAKKANCFDTTIDGTKKLIIIRFLPGIKVVVNSSKTVDIYRMEGYSPVTEVRERERVTNYCVINESSIEGSLKKILSQD